MNDTHDKERLLTLIRDHALLEGGDFELAQGSRVTTYIDLRRVIMHPEGAALIGTMLLARLVDSSIAAVGGMATAAIPVVTSVVIASHSADAPLRGFYVRERAKTRGTQRQIEGQMQQGDRIALLEDTITSGRSTMTAVEAVRAEGGIVDRVITVVDRQQGGRELYAAENISFDALVTLTDITGG
ncbi:MAG: orotate phosphoribosyltransferase [Rhodospirillales bacterium]|nr:orotate phosphoribosyltransferase [Rhodospirillales bacterium]